MKQFFKLVRSLLRLFIPAHSEHVSKGNRLVGAYLPYDFRDELD